MLFLFISTCILLIVTLLPLRRSQQWWVRNWAFPRQHIVVLAGVLLLCTFIFLEGALQYSILGTLLVGIILYQVSWLYPYTKLKRATVEQVEPDKERDIKCLASNVQMGNDDFAAVSTLIKEEQPDIVFLMETDERWFESLQSVLEKYATVEKELKDNCYGCVFATNLEVIDVNIHYIAGDDTPSVHATLKDKTGETFIFRGLHPRPPMPGTSSKKRDEELRQTAAFARENEVPEVIMGDFNDVVWSRNSVQFKRLGKYYDPQVGRTCIKSFHARFRFLRFPIDQFYVTKSVRLVELYRGPYVGSDHFPLIAKVRFMRKTNT